MQRVKRHQRSLICNVLKRVQFGWNIISFKNCYVRFYLLQVIRIYLKIIVVQHSIFLYILQ